MTTPKRPRDPNQLAKFIVDVATGDAVESDAQSAPSPQSLGGKKMVLNLPAAKRTEIAKNAASVRWRERQDKSDA